MNAKAAMFAGAFKTYPDAVVDANPLRTVSAAVKTTLSNYNQIIASYNQDQSRQNARCATVTIACTKPSVILCRLSTNTKQLQQHNCNRIITMITLSRTCFMVDLHKFA